KWKRAQEQCIDNAENSRVCADAYCESGDSKCRLPRTAGPKPQCVPEVLKHRNSMLSICSVVEPKASSSCARDARIRANALKGHYMGGLQSASAELTSSVSRYSVTSFSLPSLTWKTKQ